MGKHQVPAGATKKEKCKCGIYFYPVLIGATGKLSNGCSICKPEQYAPQKENK